MKKRFKLKIMGQQLEKKYKIPDEISVISDSAMSREKQYVLSVRDLPSSEKPREKLIVHGPGLLSAQELLAALLNTGTRKEGVLEMSSRILREYGEKSIFSQTNAKQMARDLNIPIHQAIQIVAAGELGRRFFRHESDGSPVIRTAKEVFEYVTDMRSLSKEHLRGLYLNAHYQLIHEEIISIGTVDANIIHPREVFRPAISSSAVAVILVHNHPSGILAQNEEDIAITRQILEAGKIIGIDLVDHVIVTKDSFISILLP